MVELQGERNYIMQVVCEATQAGDADVQVAAFECLVKIMSYFYDFMQMYMEKALFGVRLQHFPCLQLSNPEAYHHLLLCPFFKKKNSDSSPSSA